MKTVKKVFPVMLSGVLLVTSVTPAFAAGEPSEKEEVIYINLDGEGSVKELYAVNIFGSGSVTDYGDYSDIKMLNTSDAISQNGDTVTFTTDAERAYYQGTLTDTEIPWNISIEYYLDGAKASPEELAGQSGDLEICFKVTENEAAEGDFFDNYALQASFTLDTEKCKNIVAADATVANVGSDKQLSYTMLPGKGIDTVITATVEDFEMSAASINGVPLSLDVEVDDEELMDQVDELLDAIDELDDGAGELKDGAGELKDGAGELKDGSGALRSGTAQLESGADSLNTGLESANKGASSLLQGVKKLNGSSAELTNGSARVKKGIANLSSGAKKIQNSANFSAYKKVMKQNGLDIDTLQSTNAQTISQLRSQIESLSVAISQMKAAGQDTSELEAQKAQLEGIVTLLTGNSAAINGTESYLNGLNSGAGELAAGASKLQDNYKTLDSGIQSYTGGVSELAAGSSELSGGMRELSEGSKNLKDGADTLYDKTGDLDAGVAELVSGIVELYDGTTELKDGTAEMRDETDGIDDDISDKIDELLESITGDGETVSFVSEKNTNVDAVQFVIQTEAIEVEEAEEITDESEEDITFVQKLLRLFGLD